MNQYTLTIIDRHTGETVEVIKMARIADRMRVNREYKGLEHDGRYEVKESVQRFDALCCPMQ